MSELTFIFLPTRWKCDLFVQPNLELAGVIFLAHAGSSLFLLLFLPLSFACQVQSRAQRNVAVQCTCGEVCADECVDVCLRVCQDIQPGSELLLYEDAVGKSQATKEQSGHEGNSDRTKNSSDKNSLHM